jgi:hypothetical protein
MRVDQIVLKTSESIWRFPVFAFICYVSNHLEISAMVVLSAAEELPILCRCSDAVDETRPVVRGQTSRVLVGREPSHLVLSR